VVTHLLHAHLQKTLLSSWFRVIPAAFLLSPSKGKDQAFANNGPTQYADATYREVTNLF